MKRFMQEWRPKNLKGLEKDERAELLYSLIPDLTEDYISKGFKKQEEVKRIQELVYDKKFISTLKSVLKNKEDFNYVDPNIAIILVDSFRSHAGKENEESGDSKLDEKIYKLISKLCKSKIKKLNAILDNKDLSEELAAILPKAYEDEEEYEKDFYVSHKNIHVFIQKAISILYRQPSNNTLYSSDVLSDLFQELFGKKYLDKVVMTILLERKSNLNYLKEEAQITMWNALTTFAIDYMSEMKKKDLRNLLSNFYNIQKKSPQIVRRFDLKSLPKEDYPKIINTIEDIEDGDDE